MQGNMMVVPFHIAGTLAADLDIRFDLPVQAKLVHVSLVASNASSAQVKIGTTDDDDAHMVLKDAGDSGAPAEYDRDDFVGGEFPTMAKGETVAVTVDYDGASGTAADDLTLVLTFV